MKEELRKAYEAGKRSVEQNKKRDAEMEQGTKQLQVEFNFENWYLSQTIHENSDFFDGQCKRGKNRY